MSKLYKYFPFDWSKFKSLSFTSIIILIGSVVASLLLLRFYPPEDIGKYSLFISLVNIATIFSTGQLQNEFLKGIDTNAKDNLLQLSAKIALMVCVLVFVLLGIVQLVQAQLNINYLVVLPITIFTNAGFVMLNNYAISQQKITLFNIARMVMSLFAPLLAILAALILRNNNMLIFTYSICLIASVSYLQMGMQKNYFNIFSLNWDKQRMIMDLRKYKNYLGFTTSSELINTLSGQLPIYWLALTDAFDRVGHFRTASRILNVPVDIISNPISTILKSDFSSSVDHQQSFSPKMKAILRQLVISSIILFGLILIFFYFIKPEIIFGKTWMGLEKMIGGLIFIYVLKFIVSPMMFLFQVMGYQKLNLVISIYLFISLLALVFLFQLFGGDKFLFIILYGLVQSFFSVVYLYLLRTKLFKNLI